jgi:hypothetical protein
MTVAALRRGGCLVVMLCIASLALPQRSHASALNLAAVSCAKYENEVLTSSVPGYKADPIDTVMWLFGFSVARSGERSLYGDSLTAFGFALDAECKNNPTSTLLDAVTSVKSKRQNPMDLSTLECVTYETRHVALRKSEPEGANTLTMWLFGYSVGLTGEHVLDPDALAKFDARLDDYCTNEPGDSLYDALSPSPHPPPKRVPAKPPAPKLAAPQN